MAAIKSALSTGVAFLIAMANASASENSPGWYTGFAASTNMAELKQLNRLNTDDLREEDEYNGKSTNFSAAFSAGYRLNDYFALNIDVSNTDIEGDITNADLNRRVRVEAKPVSITPGVKFFYAVNHKMDLYAKLGAAISFAEYHCSDSDNREYYQERGEASWDLSAALSVGTQWRLNAHWAINAEYTRNNSTLDFDSEHGNEIKVNYDNRSVALGLNYRF
ncbi:opacity protein-like surface antigen [Sinobacterium caligoides]|uniref:Opacity protein-like surface antigen n=1 Tax=Sinobacterium caligoides TaxID=933926 RepID=A0A3N2DPM8_9GAMM|nr:porin family protein [Sinobacterium caligoides]ROS01761.1 opacity protein-like surface antigen [Sinobacterium caligoides]